MPPNGNPAGFIATIHEERIRRLEEKSTEQAGDHAIITAEFKNISTQIAKLDNTLEVGVKGLSEKMTKLTETVNTHTAFIDKEKKSQEDTAHRKGRNIRALSLIGLPLLGALGANSGKSIYEWITRLLNG